MAAATVVSSWMNAHYELGKCLSQGACGSIYIVRSKKHGLFHWPLHKPHYYVCKVQKDENIIYYKQEVKIMRLLKNIKSVVTLKEYHEDNRISYIIMEKCKCDLADAIRHTFMIRGEEKTASLFEELLKTVKNIHLKGIVHRDLKLENVLVTKDEHLKVSDFGTSIECKPGERLRGVIGSARYIAPEIYREEPYGKQVDVYSLGIILYYLVERNSEPYKLSGRELGHLLMMEANSGIDIARKHLKFTSCSEGVKELVLKMTHPDPEKRITIEEALRDPWLKKNAKAYTSAAYHGFD